MHFSINSEKVSVANPLGGEHDSHLVAKPHPRTLQVAKPLETIQTFKILHRIDIKDNFLQLAGHTHHFRLALPIPTYPA